MRTIHSVCSTHNPRLEKLWHNRHQSEVRLAPQLYSHSTAKDIIHDLEVLVGLELEDELGKPVVTSNQSVLWACLKRLEAKLGPVEPIPGLGRLFGA